MKPIRKFVKLFSFSIFVFASALIAPSSSHALTISHLEGTGPINPSRASHIFVIGYAGGLADQLFKTAVSRARRYHELYPERLIVVIGPDKIDTNSRYYDSYEEYESTLDRLNLEIDLMDERWLLSHRLLDILEDYSDIKSLEFVSHSAAHLGVGLDKVPESSRLYRYKRFNSRTEGIERLTNNFSEDAYMILHGCNSGFIQAPELAQIFEIPVAGSLSFTNTQEIYTDQNWYFNDEGKYPEHLSRMSYNPMSFQSGNHYCRSGHCHRLKPEPYPYAGYWGRLNAGLSHYKFFCGERSPSLACKKAMGLSVLGHPSMNNNPEASFENYKLNVKDFLCPDANRPDARRSCYQQLEASLNNPNVHYTGMIRGKTLDCDFESCDVRIECTNDRGSCQITHAPDNHTPRTMQREYRAFIEAYPYL